MNYHVRRLVLRSLCVGVFAAADIWWCSFCRLKQVLLKMNILMSETCWAHNKWNKIASDIKLVFHSSTIAMMHGPINIRFSVGVCIETRLRFGGPGVRISIGTRDCHFSDNSKETSSPTLPHIFPGGKAPGRKVKHSPLSSANVQNEWSYGSVPSIRFHSLDMVNIIFTFHLLFM